ncbi:MAG TPA: hypothetical protein VMI54_08860 [Polyangiaceae bacterium]|nr:hypothetical protein [Polyangiaceae bacterium]
MAVVEKGSSSQMIERSQAYEIVVASLREVFEQTGTEAPAKVGDETVLVGTDAVLDSLGIVQLIVEIEQRVEGAHGVSITLASDKAMSQRNSPFRTVGVLTDHVIATAQEAAP